MRTRLNYPYIISLYSKVTITFRNSSASAVAVFATLSRDNASFNAEQNICQIYRRMYRHVLLT